MTAAALAMAALVQGAAAPVYRVEPIAVDARVADLVGAKRSGSLCLPAGSIAWREARPEPGDARDAFAAGLRATGVSVGDTGNPFHDSSRGADRAIRVSLRAVRLSACVPPAGWGRLFNHSHAIKGEGALAVTWRVYGREQDAPLATGAACVRFSYREPQATLPLMTLAGIEAAGRRVASDLLSADGTLQDADESCRLDERAPAATAK